MSSEKSVDALDINGLAIFKENIVKKYLKQGDAPSVVGRAIYRALQQYKKDVVRFYASYSSLPNVGNPGTLYFIHKSVDKEHDDLNTKYARQIWFSLSGTSDYAWCKYSDSVDSFRILRNEAGYYVLNLSDIDQTKFSYLKVYLSSNSSSYSIYLPNTETLISTYEQLASLSGKILGFHGGSYGNGSVVCSGAVEIPRLTYTGELPAQYIVPDDEIWILSDNPTLRVKVNDFNNNYVTITERNQYGYFVLKKGIHIPITSDTTPYLYLDGNEYRCYKVDRDNTYPVQLSQLSHYTSLYGHIVVKSKLDKVIMLYVVYPYDRGYIACRKTADIIVPDDEIWIDNTNWPAMYLGLNGVNGPYIALETNEYGKYVINKNVLDNVETFTGMILATQSSNNNIASRYTPGYSGSFNYTGLYVYKLCDGQRIPSNDISERITTLEDAYTLLGKIIRVAGWETISILHNDIPPRIIPESEVWIAPDGWDNVDTIYLLHDYRKTDTGGYARYESAAQLFKNAYGYYVLNLRVLTSLSSYYSPVYFSKQKSIGKSSNLWPSIRNGETTSALWGGNYKLFDTDESSYQGRSFNEYAGKIATILPRNKLISSVVSPSYTTEYVDDLISSAPQDTSDNKFVIYTWANGKYRQLSSAIFDTGDLHLERITDQVLSLISHNAISNKAFCDALRYKFSIANILETPVAGYDNPVESKGIKAALDRLVTWEDIECIPITDEEIHTLFTTYAQIPLESANYYRIVIRGIKSEGANYLSKIFDVETLEGLTFSERSPDGPSLSETLTFIEDDTGRHIPVTVSCANKYNSPTMFYPGDLFDQNTDGYYRADTSANDLVLTIDIRRHLAMSTLRKLTFQCLAGRPYQTTVPPVERLFVSVYGSIGGVDYPYFRKDVIYTPNRVANDGVYTIPLFPSA